MNSNLNQARVFVCKRACAQNRTRSIEKHDRRVLVGELARALTGRKLRQKEGFHLATHTDTLTHTCGHCTIHVIIYGMALNCDSEQRSCVMLTASRRLGPYDMCVCVLVVVAPNIPTHAHTHAKQRAPRACSATLRTRNN